ncbi:MAG: AMIN domain-containing protein [Thermodesulfobacteriota bacterium]
MKIYEYLPFIGEPRERAGSIRAARGWAFATCALLLVVFLGLSSAQAGGAITDVKLSDDTQRIVIQFDGEMGAHTTKTLPSPPRLVIDVPSVRADSCPQRQSFQKKPVREVRVEASGRGSRITVDFGEHEVPQHRIRRMENLLVVFLGDHRKSPHALTEEFQQKLDHREERPLARARAMRSPRPWTVPAAKESRPVIKEVRPAAAEVRPSPESTDLFVKQASVDDGALLVELGRKSQPGTGYLIRLGIDLVRLGIRTAQIDEISTNPRQQASQTVVAQVTPRMPSPKYKSPGPRRGEEPPEQVRTAQAPISGPRRSIWEKVEPSNFVATWNGILAKCGFQPSEVH